jgi:hypothetical protein
MAYDSKIPGVVCDYCSKLIGTGRLEHVHIDFRTRSDNGSLQDFCSIDCMMELTGTEEIWNVCPGDEGDLL